MYSEYFNNSLLQSCNKLFAMQLKEINGMKHLGLLLELSVINPVMVPFSSQTQKNIRNITDVYFIER
ncbi:hypothetical protein HMPREF9104_03178 [Lentilactobacillus kisonensis F0435]|uniref:Uncharacterized protein n=1 Tax=Lentilactobacillus kisonensis F0435 TaxID=797516 RepID=H1LKM4_9LACO|nr:hypothetical protein HMPREF9104_03178 [Lentilactobacillus kisonensis F0435]